MPSLGYQTEIWRECTIICGACSLVILVRVRDVIREFPRAFFNFAFVIGFCIIFMFLGHCLSFIDGVSCRNEGAPWDSTERVAGRADLAVDLETPAKSDFVSDPILRGPSHYNVEGTHAWWSKVFDHFMCSQGYFGGCNL
jgi:hypothetical protein